MVAPLNDRSINIHDERAKELAQVLTNDKALAILHLIEDRELSISEIAKELNLPISTVSYHMDRMLRVGLVEVTGRKYGKRLQEVKLYHASNKPILLLPRKTAAGVKKKPFLGFENLHVISLALAGLISAAVYAVSRRLLVVSPEKGTENLSTSAQKVAPMIRTSPINTSTVTAPAMRGVSHIIPPVLGITAFILTLVLFLYILRRRG